MGALENIRVLDLSTMLSGPFGSQMLGDLGAEVIKIETPSGDGTRIYQPHFSKGTSMYFMAYNRNKKSVVINLKTAEGKQAFYDLVKTADVVWDNFRPGITKKLGIDYETLKTINQSIICASITGFGTGNPYGNRPSYDLCVQAESGVLAMTGEKDRPAVKLGVPMGDLGGGWYAVVGVLAAIIERERTGKGQFVDVGMLDTLVSLHGYEGVYYLFSGIVPERLGTAHRNTVPYQTFRTKDIDIAIVCGLDKFWFALCKAIGIDEATAEKYGTMKLRYDFREEVVNMVQNVLLTDVAENWVKKLDEAGVPCGAVNPLDRAFENPALKERDMVISVDNQGETIRLIGNPIKMSASKQEYACPPQLGEHTVEVFKSIGYTDEKIKSLEECGAIEDSKKK